MSVDSISVGVDLAGCEYRFACRPAEREELLEAARFLDLKMREIRSHGGGTLSTQAIAVMAALNLSHDLLRERRQIAATDTLIKNHVWGLLQQVNDALQ